jgi:Yip1 domain
MMCPKCRQTMNDGARFCSSCGESIPAEPVARATDAPFTPAWSTAGGPSASPAAGVSPLMHSFFNRAKDILLNPRNEWHVIAPEDTGVPQLFKGYVLPLAGLAVIVQFLHMSVVGISLPFGGTIRQPLTMGLTYALLGLIAGVIGVFLVGLIINALAPTFGGTRDQRQALKTAAYSLTPAWLGVVFSLLPAMGTLLELVAGVYGIYILYLGLPVLMRSRRESAAAYTATVVVCTIVLGILFGVVSAAIGVGTMGGFGALSHQRSEEAGQQMAANAAASIIGGALGTDDKGKAGIANAISNLAKAGEQMEAAERAQRARQAAGSAASDGSAASGANGASVGDAASAGNGAAGSADPQANAVNATAGFITALGGAVSGGRHVEPVSFQTLEGLLPASLPGMTRENLQGSGKQALGVKGTSATATYRGANDARIEIEIADASGVSGLLDLADSLGVSETSESSNGYERQSTIAGRTVHEKFDRSSNHGEVSAIIAKRFTVAVSGYSVDMGTLHEAFGGLDLAALDGMKDAGAH